MTADEARRLALESSVRFTDRAKNTVDTMLKNAETIEGWLNRDIPKLKFVDKNGAGAGDTLATKMIG
jgi:hypothetical protein